MARNLYGEERVRSLAHVGLSPQLLELWEDVCMMMCRYAHQGDVARVESWPIDLLYARHASLTRILQGEHAALETS